MGDFPLKFKGVSNEAHAAPISLSMIERQFDLLQSPEYQRQREAAAERRMETNIAIAEQAMVAYFKVSSISEVTSEQRREFWDKWSEYYWKYLVAHTNILEVLE